VTLLRCDGQCTIPVLTHELAARFVFQLYRQPLCGQSKYKNRQLNPCAEKLEKVLNSMEAANYSIRPIWKLVRELDQCLADNKYDPTKEKKSTMFYLNQYLDQQKHKTK
jgi:hypothetical protein